MRSSQGMFGGAGRRKHNSHTSCWEMDQGVSYLTSIGCGRDRGDVMASRRLVGGGSGLGQREVFYIKFGGVAAIHDNHMVCWCLWTCRSFFWVVWVLCGSFPPGVAVFSIQPFTVRAVDEVYFIYRSQSRRSFHHLWRHSRSLWAMQARASSSLFSLIIWMKLQRGVGFYGIRRPTDSPYPASHREAEPPERRRR